LLWGTVGRSRISEVAVGHFRGGIEGRLEQT
jgi:hypothetical protein